MKRLALFLLPLIAGCGGGGTSGGTPVISVSKPTNGTKFPLVGLANVDITAEFTVTNFMLIPAAQTDGGIVAGQGHMHLYLDEETQYRTSGASPLTAKGVTLGMHTLKLILRNNDHTAVDSVAPVAINVEVVP